MIADIGTRPCRSLDAVDSDSRLHNGDPWMTEDRDKFPALTVEEVRAKHKVEDPTESSLEELYDFNSIPGSTYHSAEEDIKAGRAVKIQEEARLRYQYSNYLIDPNRHRFRDVVRSLALACKFINNTRQCVADRKNSQALPQPKDIILLTDEEIKQSKDYFFRKASQEVKKFLKPAQYQNISRELEEVLYYTGRILPEDEVSIVGQATEVMKDLCKTTYCVPLMDKYSPIAYSVINEIHWHDPSVCHSGVETTWRYVLKNIYVIDGRSVVKMIRNSCQRCRYLAKRALEVSMGPVSQDNITIAPAFFICQVDLAGPFPAYSSHNKRSTIKVWLAVFCCTTTSATKIKLMENYNTTSFLQAFTRFSCDVGYPKRILADEGSQLVKGCKTMRIDFQDLQFKLHQDVHVQLDVCPVGGHNMHGKVERRIRHIKESLEKTMSNERLSVMQWETVAASVANSINNLPLALGNFKGDFESMDLITPNRLLLGRNNDRCPVGALSVASDLDKIIASNQKIFNSWFENWLLSHVPKLMEQPKWFRNDQDLKVGDVVLFSKQESELNNTYQFGIIDSVEVGRDNRIRKVTVRYRNNSEKVDRTTYRSARSLIVIHHVDEINILQRLGQIAIEVDEERRNARQ